MIHRDETLKKVGAALYKKSFKEYRRYMVFRARCFWHKREIDDLLAFFDETPLRRELLALVPSFVEQPTRAFFYKASTWEERLAAVKNHVITLEEHFSPEFIRQIYTSGATLWNDEIEGKRLHVALRFHAGQRKEGCITLVMHWEGVALFQVFLRFDRNAAGELECIIGALQGHPHGGESVKLLTKAYEGYRPKNLMFYLVRLLSESVGAVRIRAVTNEGYYAMNHVRLDRKLKTDFSVFWTECEGVLDPKDSRFFLIPVEEPRKSLEEVKANKRAQYRRRFEKLDAIKVSVLQRLQKGLTHADSL